MSSKPMPYTEDELQEVVTSLDEERQALAEDIQELYHYERRVRIALGHLDKYISHWQEEARRLRRSITSVEQKRLDLEKQMNMEEMIARNRQRTKRASMSMDSIVSTFAKLSDEEKLALLATLQE